MVREAFVGVRRFADFEANLDISKNILSARLEHLVAHGVLARVDAGVHGTRYEYELTLMGKDLATVMTALREWGDRWIDGGGREPLLALDRRSGRRTRRLRILDNEGRPLAVISRWPQGRGRADGRAPASVHLESAALSGRDRVLSSA